MPYSAAFRTSDAREAVILLGEEGENLDALALGFRLAWRKARSGKSYPHCEPSPKSCGKLREAIREETTRSSLWKQPEEVIARVNRRVRGWIGYPFGRLRATASTTPKARPCSARCNGRCESA